MQDGSLEACTLLKKNVSAKPQLRSMSHYAQMPTMGQPQKLHLPPSNSLLNTA